MTPEEYVGRCRGVIISVAEELDPEDVGWAMHLVDHDEAPEGIAALAWALETARGGIDAALADDLNELISGLVPMDSLPPSLRRATPDEGLASDAPQHRDGSCGPGWS